MFGSEVDSERTFDKIRSMGRTGVRRRRMAVLATGAVLAGLWVGPVGQALGGAGGPMPISSHRYVVRGGDTLWSIAHRVVPEEDPRPVVDAIADANDVRAGDIRPGQILVIPQAG